MQKSKSDGITRPALALLGLMTLGSVAFAVTHEPKQFVGRMFEGLLGETVALYAGGIAALGIVKIKDSIPARMVSYEQLVKMLEKDRQRIKTLQP